MAQKIAKVDQERAKLSKSIRETKEIQKRLAGKLRLELGEMKEAALHLKSTFKADLRTASGHLESAREAYKKLVRVTTTLKGGMCVADYRKPCAV